MDKSEEKLLKILSREVSQSEDNECPSFEDISALVDGTIEDEKKEIVQSHIASCDICYETFLTVNELNKTPNIASFGIFPKWSIAASVFVVLLSFVVFYRVNNSRTENIKPKISGISEQLKMEGLPKAEKNDLKIKKTESEKKIQSSKPQMRKAKIFEKQNVRKSKYGKSFAKMRNVEVEESPSQEVNEMVGIASVGNEILSSDESNRSEILFLDTSPELLKIVQPKIPLDSDGMDNLGFLVLEVIADRDGGVKSVSFLAGNWKHAHVVTSVVKKWKFLLKKPLSVRFLIKLGITSEGRLKIMDKKK